LGEIVNYISIFCQLKHPIFLEKFYKNFKYFFIADYLLNGKSVFFFTPLTLEKMEAIRCKYE